MKRFLHERIAWDGPLVVITGSRGTGKTTLMLQRMVSARLEPERALYLSADHIQVAALGLYPLAEAFFKAGGALLMVDEVHKDPDWSRIIKSLTDSFPSARIVVSGSSSLNLTAGKADLSRRAVYYHLPALSLREFFELRAQRKHSALGLDELLADHARVAGEVLAAGPVLGLLREYLAQGAYPFGIEQADTYLQRLGHVIEKVLYEDIPAVTRMRASGVPAMKKILYQVATSPPHEINLDRLSGDLGISRQTVYTYLDHLERAGLIRCVLPAGAGATITRRRAKLLMDNPNLLQAVSQDLGQNGLVGALRETFFASQLAGAGHELRAPKVGDFSVGRHLFEIGGRKKSRKQVATEADAWLVKDELETGAGRSLPLWLFGFLY
jgi:predicted AAA+ superfamily ATPase